MGGVLRLANLVAGLTLVACTTTPGGLSATALETEMAGGWNGTATLALTGRAPIPYSTAIIITVVGATANVTKLCPGSVRQRQDMVRARGAVGSQGSSVDATGSGASASWSGTLTCPLVELSGCNLVAITYTNATVTLTGTNQVTIVGAGNAEACGTNYPVFLTFVGSK